MAAKPPHLQVDCPPSRHDGGRQRREWSNNGPTCGDRACAVVVLVLLAGALVTGLAFLGIFLDHRFPSEDPVVTVAITGVTGLLDDPAAAAGLSPVFDLAFQIDNTRNAFNEACVPGLARAVVSYGDAFLAGGSVPPFCAGERRRSGPVAARAWGENVAVPQFLRDQLAAELAAGGGDAAVDVKVTLPTFCHSKLCGRAVLSCKAKIRGGASSACRVDFL